MAGLGTVHQPKSDAAHMLTLSTLADLERNPLGSGRNENFGVPSNYVVPPAKVYVINHSRSVARKRIIAAVSYRRGAEDALREDPELRNTYNIDTMYARVREGVDLNRYKTDIKPVKFEIKFDGQSKIIPPCKEPDGPPLLVEVPEGIWDLYLGNYERMRGIVRGHDGEIKRVGDATVISDERSRLAVMWRMRKNPVMRWTDDGEVHNIDNPFGFLEFVRESIRPQAELEDKDYLSALDLMEAS